MTQRQNETHEEYLQRRRAGAGYVYQPTNDLKELNARLTLPVRQVAARVITTIVNDATSVFHYNEGVQQRANLIMTADELIERLTAATYSVFAVAERPVMSLDDGTESVSTRIAEAQNKIHNRLGHDSKRPSGRGCVMTADTETARVIKTLDTAWRPMKFTMADALALFDTVMAEDDEVVTEQSLTLAQITKWNQFGVIDERPS
jgi:carbon starvation protein CstA